MSRVWKKFFVRVGKGLTISFAVAIWFFIVILFYKVLGISEDAAGFLVPFTTVIVPSGVFFLRALYKDCKAEVDRENQEILNAIKGDVQ